MPLPTYLSLDNTLPGLGAVLTPALSASAIAPSTPARAPNVGGVM